MRTAVEAVVLAALTVLLVVFAGGCKPELDTLMHVQVPVEASPRITVVRIGVFKDDLAYDSRRWIYVIKDAATGREYVGVSGIGISELGVHYKNDSEQYERDER